jgi:hypothetical protein
MYAVSMQDYAGSFSLLQARGPHTGAYPAITNYYAIAVEFICVQARVLYHGILILISRLWKLLAYSAAG